MSHCKVKKNDYKLHVDRKLNRFFDHKLDTPLYIKLGLNTHYQRYQEKRAVITTNDDDNVCRHQPITIFVFLP